MSSFDLNLHHGGYFEIENEELKYVCGTCMEVGPFQTDTFCFWTLKEKLDSGHFGLVHRIWFAPRGMSLKEDRLVLSCENDILGLLEEAKLHGYVSIYIDHVDDFEHSDSSSDGNGTDDEDGLYVSTDSGSKNDLEMELDKECFSKDSLFSLGDTFDDLVILKKLLFKYTLDNNKDLKYDKSDRHRLTAVCSVDGCPWRLHASFDSGSHKFKIKTYNDDHRCTVSGKNRLFGRQRLIEMFLEKLRENTFMKAFQMRAEVLERYGVRLTLPQCHGSRHKCLQIIQKDHEVQFEWLWDYVAEMRSSNGCSIVRLQTKGDVFRRIYICFSALSDGWRRGCRIVIHLDGAFLEWNLKGKLLAAIGRDANDQLFPIAWAIVEVENKKIGNGS